MNFTVKDITQLVGKDAGYIRQHIKRKQLRAERQGKSLVISRPELTRWAREWELPLDSKVLTSFESSRSEKSTKTSSLTDRTTRVRIIAYRVDNEWINLITTLRRRQDTARQPLKQIHNDLGDDIIILGGDLSLNESEDLIERARNGSISVGNINVKYLLEHRRKHFVSRGEVSKLFKAEALPSPFCNASARVIEYWSKFVIADHEANTLLKRLSSWDERLGIRLSQRRDRLGNLLVFDAADDISVDLISEGDSAVRIQSDATNRFEPGDYYAVMELYLDDDLVVHKHFPLIYPTQIIKTQSDWDAYRLTVFRASTGESVDDIAFYMLREIGITMNLVGNEISVRAAKKNTEIRRLKKRFDAHEMVVKAEDNDWIRTKQLARRAYNREQKAIAQEEIARFESDTSTQAREFFFKQIEKLWGREGLYIGDPYFFHADPNDPFLRDLLLDLFAAAGGRPLKILSAAESSKSIEGTKARWEKWSQWPLNLRSGILARSVLKLNSKQEWIPAFHDRFIASPKGEIILTHSLNGWNVDGVTFIKSPTAVYYPVAENLWNRTTDSAWKVRPLW